MAHRRSGAVILGTLLVVAGCMGASTPLDRASSPSSTTTTTTRPLPCQATATSGSATVGTITTVAGGGKGKPEAGGSAVDARLGLPTDVAIGVDGCLYIADASANRIWRVGEDGTVSIAAGTGQPGFAGDGGPGPDAQVNRPIGVAVDTAGNVYIADQGNNRVRRLDPAGIITTIAGTGADSDTGDGGPASEAALASPNGIAIDVAGSVYIAEGDARRVRRIDPAGRMRTFAGTGEYGWSGDGGPARAARFESTFDVAVDASGNVFIADADDQRIRKVDAAGTITTVAGTGERGAWSDGSLAVNAMFNDPGALAIGPGGWLYFADHHSDRIGAIDLDGVLHFVTGVGRGFSGDGGPAVYAAISQPWGLAFDPGGRFLYVADAFNYRVRRIVVASSPAAIQV